MAALVSAALFASLSLNLIVQFGLGIEEMPEDGVVRSLPFFQAGVLFVTVFALWALFSYIVTPFFSVLFKYFLLFPFSMLSCWALELAASRFIPKIIPQKKLFNAATAYNGLAFTALTLTLHIASTVLEAFVVSLNFSLGVLFSIFILDEIQRRSSFEAVPVFLRGKPLRLISMGFLSIIFSSTAAILLIALLSAT
ncbi:MAG: hypothetical protein LBH85_04275 [Treponema sp.]|jgi:Na+-transporting NADH:ubiquinone oxidoreductase subunit NqrE|nr:hypothetical protein [Treponema sp.]